MTRLPTVPAPGRRHIDDDHDTPGEAAGKVEPMGRPRKVLWTTLIALGMSADTAALAIWVTRLPPIYSEWLGLAGPQSEAPLHVARAWADGKGGPLTPTGFLGVFETTDLLVSAGLIFALVVSFISLGATWSRPRVLSRVGSPLRIPWPPPMRVRVRGVLIAIAILGLGLGWEITSWQTWRLKERLLAQVYTSSQKLSSGLESLAKLRGNLSTLPTSPETWAGDTRTEEARESDHARSCDRLLGKIAHAELMVAHHASLKEKYERAVDRPRLPVEPDPPPPEPEPEFLPDLLEPDHARTLAAYEEEIRRYPALVWAHTSLAWILAACPDPRIRDGKTATPPRTRACELTNWRGPEPLMTLAAAYAEAGDFGSAVEWEEKALEQFRLSGDLPNATDTSRLDLYRSGRPLRLAR